MNWCVFLWILKHYSGIIIATIMAEPFNMDKWTEEFELSADTLKVMADKGFNSMKTICKLNPDLIKKELKGLHVFVAQSLMLQDGVDSLQPEAQKPARQPETIASVVENEPQDAHALQQKLNDGKTLSVTDLMAMLGTTPKEKETTPQDQPCAGKAAIFDTLIQLMSTSGVGKAPDISEYISSHCRDDSSEEP